MTSAHDGAVSGQFVQSPSKVDDEAEIVANLEQVVMEKPLAYPGPSHAKRMAMSKQAFNPDTSCETKMGNCDAA